MKRWTQNAPQGVEAGPPQQESGTSPTASHQFLPFRGVRNDTHTYLSLEPSFHQIRYIAVDPGSHDAPLSCFLGYTSLRRKRRRKHINYEAVSYCWGEVSDTVEISLCCATRKSATAQSPRNAWTLQPYRVTRNLDTLLRAFRRPDKHRVLWVDAICINQADDTEKMHQVGAMGSIYRSAFRVLVWLGESDLCSDIVVESYRVFATKLSCRPLFTWYQDAMEKRFEPNLWPGGDGGSFWYTTILEDIKLWRLIRKGYPASLETYGRDVNPYRPPYQGLWPFLGAAALLHVILYSAERLFSRDWFHRIWVLQEIILAPLTPEGNRLVTVFMGHTHVEWNELVAFAHILSRSNGLIFYNHAFFRDNWSLFTIPPKGETGVTHYLHEYIERTVGFRSSDPRDRLFALLPLSADTRDTFRSNSLLQPDYSKSLASVLTDYRRWQLGNTCRTIDILSCPALWNDRMFEKADYEALNDYQDPYHAANMSLDDECGDFEGLASASSGPESTNENQAHDEMSHDDITEASITGSNKNEEEEEEEEEEEDDTTAPQETDSEDISVVISASEGGTLDGSDTSVYPSGGHEPLDYLLESKNAKGRGFPRGMPSWVTNIFQDKFELDYGSYDASKKELAVVDIQSSQSSIFLLGLPLTKIVQAAMARHGPQTQRYHKENSDGEDCGDTYDQEWDINAMWDRVRTESIELRRRATKSKHKEDARHGVRRARNGARKSTIGALWRRRPPSPDETNLRQALLTSVRMHPGPFTTGLPSTDEKRIFITTDGDFVLAPEDARPGDPVVILFGSRVPFLLRRDSYASVGTGPRWRYRILGSCFFYGDKWMKGKELARGALDHVPKRFFELV